MMKLDRKYEWGNFGHDWGNFGHGMPKLPHTWVTLAMEQNHQNKANNIK